MRKLLVAVAAVLVCSSTVFAQSTKAKTKFGFKAGVNLSDFRTAVNYSDVKTKMLAGVVLGTYVNIPLSSRFSLQPEFCYSQLGAKSQSITQWGGYYTFRYNYFAIPLLVKFNVTKSFILIAGGEGDILIRARQRGTPSKTITYDIKDFDFLYTAGVGYRTKKWSFDLRYLHGSQDVSLNWSETTFFNRAVQFSIGYQLDKKAKKAK